VARLALLVNPLIVHTGHFNRDRPDPRQNRAGLGRTVANDPAMSLGIDLVREGGHVLFHLLLNGLEQHPLGAFPKGFGQDIEKSDFQNAFVSGTLVHGVSFS
jgi:hypothetical protein